MSIKEIISSSSKPAASRVDEIQNSTVQSDQPETINAAETRSTSLPETKEKENIEIPFSESVVSKEPRVKNNPAVLSVSETLSPKEFMELGPLHAPVYLFKMIQKENKLARTKLVQQISDYLYETHDGRWVKLLLYAIEYEWPSFHIYPNEIIWYLLHEREGFLSELGFDNIVLNSQEVEQDSHSINNTVIFKVKANERIKGFSITTFDTESSRFEYTFNPGHLGEYYLTVSQAGKYEMIIRGELLGKTRVQKLNLAFV